MVDSIGTIGSYIPPRQAPVVPGHTQTATPEKAVVENEGAAKSAASAIFLSPTFQIDHKSNMVIYVQRDTETGEVINQYPTKKIVEAYAVKNEKTETPKPVEKHENAAPAPVETRQFGPISTIVSGVSTESDQPIVKEDA